MLAAGVSWVLLVALARAQRVLVTSLEDNTLPVFEVFDPEADQVLGLVTLHIIYYEILMLSIIMKNPISPSTGAYCAEGAG